jgi:hypothetical protein
MTETGDREIEKILDFFFGVRDDGKPQFQYFATDQHGQNTD